MSSCCLKIKSCFTIFFSAFYHWSPTCLLPCLPFIVSDTNGVTTNLNHVASENVACDSCCSQMTWINNDQQLPAPGASITMYNHKHAHRRCKSLQWVFLGGNRWLWKDKAMVRGHPLAVGHPLNMAAFSGKRQWHSNIFWKYPHLQSGISFCFR